MAFIQRVFAPALHGSSFRLSEIIECRGARWRDLVSDDGAEHYLFSSWATREDGYQSWQWRVTVVGPSGPTMDSLILGRGRTEEEVMDSAIKLAVDGTIRAAEVRRKRQKLAKVKW